MYHRIVRMICILVIRSILLFCFRKNVSNLNSILLHNIVELNWKKKKQNEFENVWTQHQNFQQSSYHMWICLFVCIKLHFITSNEMKLNKRWFRLLLDEKVHIHIRLAEAYTCPVFAFSFPFLGSELNLSLDPCEANQLLYFVRNTFLKILMRFLTSPLPLWVTRRSYKPMRIL